MYTIHCIIDIAYPKPFDISTMKKILQLKEKMYELKAFYVVSCVVMCSYSVFLMYVQC